MSAPSGMRGLSCSALSLLVALGPACSHDGRGRTCDGQPGPPRTPRPLPSSWASRPWATTYGPSGADTARLGSSFGLVVLDADPGCGNYSPDEIARLEDAGAAVVSYLDLGSCESFRAWFRAAPGGLVPCKANVKAQRGSYRGYPDETWMDLGDPDWQALVTDHIAQVLAATGVQGFFLDNLELVEHGAAAAEGPCDARCVQGGLDLVRALHERYPGLLLIMQNATSAVTRQGTTGGVAFPALLDGVSHEEVFAPLPDPKAQAELSEWRGLHLKPRGQDFFLGTEDYVGSCANVTAARPVYAQSRAAGFSPYASDQSAGQQAACFWPF